MICTRGDVRRGTDCRIRHKFLARFNGYDLRNVQESRAVNECEVVQSLSLLSSYVHLRPDLSSSV